MILWHFFLGGGGFEDEVAQLVLGVLFVFSTFIGTNYARIPFNCLTCIHYYLSRIPVLYRLGNARNISSRHEWCESYHTYHREGDLA